MRVVRIVRRPVERMLSAYLNGKHLMRAHGYTFPRNVSFATVVSTITALPDHAVNPHVRRQGAMCAVPPGRVEMRVLRLEDYQIWRPWLMAAFNWTTLPVAVRAPRTSADRVTTFYTREMVRRVEAWAAEDMRRFGYAPWTPAAHARA
tara:strand:- start:39 stop:482 length:444 start_codon:yes stop_codon:yes gene_type:complete